MDFYLTQNPYHLLVFPSSIEVIESGETLTNENSTVSYGNETILKYH